MALHELVQPILEVVFLRPEPNDVGPQLVKLPLLPHPRSPGGLPVRYHPPPLPLINRLELLLLLLLLRVVGSRARVAARARGQGRQRRRRRAQVLEGGRIMVQAAAHREPASVEVAGLQIAPDRGGERVVVGWRLLEGWAV